MKKILALCLLAALPFSLSACCSASEARFWEVRDTGSGATVYTVDTIHVAAESIQTKYVDHSGHFAFVSNPVPVRQMSETEWQSATSGAGYALRYCGIRKACWAAVSER